MSDFGYDKRTGFPVVRDTEGIWRTPDQGYVPIKPADVTPVEVVGPGHVSVDAADLRKALTTIDPREWVPLSVREARRRLNEAWRKELADASPAPGQRQGETHVNYVTGEPCGCDDLASVVACSSSGGGSEADGDRYPGDVMMPPETLADRLEADRRLWRVAEEMFTPAAEHVHEWTRRQNVTTGGHAMPAYEVCECGKVAASETFVEEFAAAAQGYAIPHRFTAGTPAAEPAPDNTEALAQAVRTVSESDGSFTTEIAGVKIAKVDAYGQPHGPDAAETDALNLPSRGWAIEDEQLKRHIEDECHRAADRGRDEALAAVVEALASAGAYEEPSKAAIYDALRTEVNHIIEREADRPSVGSDGCAGDLTSSRQGGDGHE